MIERTRCKLEEKQGDNNSMKCNAPPHKFRLLSRHFPDSMAAVIKQDIIY